MSPEQSHHPDYNFIMNPASPSKKRLLGGGSKQRLLVIIAGGLLLLLVIFMLFSLAFGGRTDNTERLVGLVRQQTELIRIASIGEKQVSNSQIKNFATTARLSLTSSKNELTGLISKQGRKLEAKDLAGPDSNQTDQALTQAQQANRFDETFNQTLAAGLKAYQQEITEAFEASDAKAERAVLQSIYNQAKVLTATSP